MSNKRARKPKSTKRDKVFYINITIALLFITLIVVLAKIFIFDTKEDNNDSTNPKQQITQKIDHDENNKYEEKAQELKIEYSDENNTQTNKDEIAKKDRLEFDYAKDLKEKLANSKILGDTKDENKSQIIEPNEPPKQKQEEIKKEDKKTINLDKKQEEPLKNIKPKEIKTPKKDNTKVPQKETQRSVANPTISIIIDDVTNKGQMAKIEQIGYPITMAFMPPTQFHKDSARIVPSTTHMVHLPLEASNRNNEESNTLHVGDSLEKIDARIKQIREWYPNARYLNNHTGSKFTEDDTSMDRLIETLKKYNFIFIDSKTTAKTVANKYTKKYGLRYIARNIFLDNIQTKQTITEQLKKAVAIAKKTGLAVVIGHPHQITLQTLKESKELLSGINLILVDKI